MLLMRVSTPSIGWLATTPILANNWQNPYIAGMGTMNISLPDDLKTFIDRQVAERGYGTSSEFIRELLRREQERQQLRNLILEGMASPPAGEADVAYFQGLRDRVAKARKAGVKRGVVKRGAK
jgi:antitoxin ParD1/3/4